MEGENMSEDMSECFDSKTQEVMDRVELLSKDIDRMANSLADKYCKDLNTYMRHIDDILVNSNEHVTDNDLEDFVLNLPSLLYFTGSAQESLGIKEDTCKAIRNEVFNTVRERCSGTVADKNSAATLASQSEEITLAIYSRAYKKVKFRIDAAYEMLNSIKKVITHRTAELELSNSRYVGTQRTGGE